MNKKISHIFSSSHCPSEKELLDYVKNRLFASKKHLVEAHLADCEMCSDYVDGLSLLPDADKIQQITIELNKKIDDVAAKKPKARFFNMRNVTAAAAVLTILVVVTFVLNNQFKKTERTETAQSTTIFEEEVVEETLEGEDELDETIVNQQEKPISATYPEETALQTGNERKDEQTPPTTTSIKPKTTGETQVQDSEDNNGRNVGFDEVDKVDDAVADVVADADYFSTVTEESEPNLEREDKREEAKGASTKTRTTESKKAEVVEVESTSSSVAEANQGIQLYNEHEYNASLKYFEDVLLKNPGDQTAQWYYALNLIALKRYDEAKVALNSIIQSGGKYKKQAEKELKKL